MTNNEKLTKFAQAVGEDIKALNIKTAGIGKTIEELIDALSRIEQGGISKTELTLLLSDLEKKIKEDLFGGDVDEALDTFKELGDKLKNLDGNLEQAILDKIKNLSTEIADSKISADLVEVYKTEINRKE